MGIQTIPFKRIPSDDISRFLLVLRTIAFVLSTRKRIFAWRVERRRDSILTLRFSWEEIMYTRRDRESENSSFLFLILNLKRFVQFLE